MLGNVKRGSGKPKPFSRPSISLGKHGKVWSDVPAKDLQPGDIVAGVGLLESVDQLFSDVKPEAFMLVLNGPQRSEKSEPDKLWRTFR